MQPFRKSLMKTIALVLGILTAALSPVFAQDLTVPTDLGTCDGYDNSVAFAINAYGQAAGMCYDGDMFEPASVATVWLPEPVGDMAAGVHKLGTLDGCDFSKAIDINDEGQVIGECSGGVGCDRKAFIWLPEADYNLNAGMHLIEGLDGATSTYVVNINNKGQVVGQSYSSGEEGLRGGFMWQAGSVTALTVSPDDSTPVSLNYNLGAKYLNESGQVIGTYKAIGTVTINGEVHSYLYDKSVIWQEGAVTPLVDEGISSEPVAINNFGEVIGRYEEGWDVFYYAPDGGTSLLGVDTSNQAFAGDINDAGQIVGWSSKGSEYACDEGGEFIEGMCNYTVEIGYQGDCTEYGDGYYDSDNGICVVEPSSIEVPAKLWMWEEGGFSDLGTFTGDPQFDILKINVIGEVAANYLDRIFYWDEGYYVDDWYGYFWSASDGLKELQTLGGSQINVYSINDAGQVVGASSTVDDTATHACVWGVQGGPAPPAAELIIDGGENPTNVGDLNVTYDNGVFNVEYLLNAPWEIVETLVYIGDAPPTKNAPGKFPYQEGEIEFAPNGGSIYIAAYAEVRMPTGESDKDGNPIFLYEGIWAQADTNIPIGKGNSWATCFEYELP